MDGNVGNISIVIKRSQQIVIYQKKELKPERVSEIPNRRKERKVKNKKTIDTFCLGWTLVNIVILPPLTIPILRKWNSGMLRARILLSGLVRCYQISKMVLDPKNYSFF